MMTMMMMMVMTTKNIMCKALEARQDLYMALLDF